MYTWNKEQNSKLNVTQKSTLSIEHSLKKQTPNAKLIQSTK